MLLTVWDSPRARVSAMLDVPSRNLLAQCWTVNVRRKMSQEPL